MHDSWNRGATRGRQLPEEEATLTDRYVVSIELGNAAMQEPGDVASVLRAIANGLESGRRGLAQLSRIMDENGNTVGSCGPEDPAAVQHLAEMRELAGRIAAMGRTLAHYETGVRPVTKWGLADELAELVNHYDPEGWTR